MRLIYSDFTFEIAQGNACFQFPAKPSERIRQILKANGFRWSPASAIWWRSRIAGASDVAEAIDKILNPPTCDERTPCWVCKAPGMLRDHGAAAPVLCNKCEAEYRAERSLRNAG